MVRSHLEVTVTNITEAKAQLSALIEKVLGGEEVIIGKAGKPLVKLVPLQRPSRPRTPGALKGTIVIAADFDDLPEDFRRAFGVIDP